MRWVLKLRGLVHHPLLLVRMPAQAHACKSCSDAHVRRLRQSVLTLPQVRLCGESNSIKYGVTPQFFDCGMQPYDRVVDKEFFINNNGKVSWGFNTMLKGCQHVANTVSHMQHCCHARVF